MMLERFWKQADTEKKVGRPISGDLLAEVGQPEAEECDGERKKFAVESHSTASIARDDAVPAADDERTQAARPAPIHVEPTPLAPATNETPSDAWLFVSSVRHSDGEADDEVDADARFVAAESALPADTSLSPQPSDQSLDGDALPLDSAMFGPARQPRQRRTRRMAKPAEKTRVVYSPEQRILLLDTWRRSGLPAKDFAALVGVSKHTLYKWKQQFAGC
jgi:hypothetical protein